MNSLKMGYLSLDGVLELVALKNGRLLSGSQRVLRLIIATLERKQGPGSLKMSHQAIWAFLT